MKIENKLNRPDRRETRKAEAAERQDTYDNLTPTQKLDRLDIRFGKNLGATKERQRLASSISNNELIPKNIEKLAVQTLPDDVMAEIEALNEDDSVSNSKKKLKAKDRRKQEKRTN